jgi:hypothetical protein
LDLLPGGVCSLAGPPWWYFLAWWLIFLGWYFPWRSHGNFIAGTPLLDFNRALHRNGGPGWDTLISSF